MSHDNGSDLPTQLLHTAGEVFGITAWQYEYARRAKHKLSNGQLWSRLAKWVEDRIQGSFRMTLEVGGIEVPMGFGPRHIVLVFAQLFTNLWKHEHDEFFGDSEDFLTHIQHCFGCRVSLVMALDDLIQELTGETQAGGMYLTHIVMPLKREALLYKGRVMLEFLQKTGMPRSLVKELKEMLDNVESMDEGNRSEVELNFERMFAEHPELGEQFKHWGKDS